MNSREGFATRLRAGDPLIGYWSMLDSVVATERIARVGYDYVCIDAQHGFGDYRHLLHSLIAVAGSPGSAGLVRVAQNSTIDIARALDAGATGVIVPMVDSADDAQRAAAACRYPPRGNRSYGPIRSVLGEKATTVDRDRDVLCLAMIETATALQNVKEICEVPGIDGVYVGPSDLSLSLGARRPGDEDIAPQFTAALQEVAQAAEAAGIAAGIHCFSGANAAQRLSEGFAFASVASDITHLENIAQRHLADFRGAM